MLLFVIRFTYRGHTDYVITITSRIILDYISSYPPNSEASRMPVLVKIPAHIEHYWVNFHTVGDFDAQS